MVRLKVLSRRRLPCGPPLGVGWQRDKLRALTMYPIQPFRGCAGSFSYNLDYKLQLLIISGVTPPGAHENRTTAWRRCQHQRKLNTRSLHVAGTFGGVLVNFDQKSWHWCVSLESDSVQLFILFNMKYNFEDL